MAAQTRDQDTVTSDADHNLQRVANNPIRAVTAKFTILIIFVALSWVSCYTEGLRVTAENDGLGLEQLIRVCMFRSCFVLVFLLRCCTGCMRFVSFERCKVSAASVCYDLVI